MAVAVGLGRSGIDQLLVASQVVLSIVLPFVMFPLVWLTTNKKIMSVKNPELNLPTLMADGPPSANTSPELRFATPKIDNLPEKDVEVSPSPVVEMVDYSNGKILAGLGYLVFAVVVVANTYVIVTLAMGKGG